MESHEENFLISRVILYDDHKAFEELLKFHHNGIKNLLLKLLNFNEAELDDLFQETSTKIYRHLKKFRGDSAFSTWVYKITYTTFLNYSKSKKRVKTATEKMEFEVVQKTESKHDAKMDVEKMISILRPEEKLAIQLAYIQGMSHKDIATVLDCPLGTVKSLIKRGKERIAKSFDNY